MVDTKRGLSRGKIAKWLYAMTMMLMVYGGGGCVLCGSIRTHTHTHLKIQLMCAAHNHRLPPPTPTLLDRCATPQKKTKIIVDDYTWNMEDVFIYTYREKTHTAKATNTNILSVYIYVCVCVCACSRAQKYVESQKRDRSHGLVYISALRFWFWLRLETKPSIESIEEVCSAHCIH